MTKVIRTVLIGACVLALHGPATAGSTTNGWRSFTADWGCAASAAMTVFFGGHPGLDGTCEGWRV